MFPRHSYQEYKDVEEAHYAYRVRERLRKQVLIPLHKALIKVIIGGDEGYIGFQKQ